MIRRPRRLGTSAAAMLALALLAPAAAAGEAGGAPADGQQIEKYPDGTKKTLTTWRDGKRNGRFEAYHPNGTIRIQASYAADRLHGGYTAYDERGRCVLRCGYKAGRLEGPYYEMYPSGRVRLFVQYRNGYMTGRLVEQGEDGKVVRDEQIRSPDWPPRSVEDLRKKVAELDPPAPPEGELYEKMPVTSGELKAGKVSKAHLEDVLGRLKAYRYITRVPYENLSIDEGHQEKAQHGAALMCIGNVFSHTPPRPAGVPEDFYKLGYAGCSSSNIFRGTRSSLKRGLDGFMDDSDPSNIAKLGHRRWCLDPGMGRTGFGICGQFMTMYSLDHSQTEKIQWDFLPFPTAGPHPVEYFGKRWAWNVRLNPRSFKEPAGGEAGVSLRPLDTEAGKTGEPLKLDYNGVAQKDQSLRYGIIFRPADLDLAPGRSYRVEIGGLKDRAGKGVRIIYDVEFCSAR